MKFKGPDGSVSGVPTPEATSMILAVVTQLASEGLEFERSRARELFQLNGAAPETVDGYLFSLQRTVPGVTHVSHGWWRLPDDWLMAAQFRVDQVKIPKLSVMASIELLKIIEGGSVGDTDGVPLRSELLAVTNEIKHQLVKLGAA